MKQSGGINMYKLIAIDIDGTLLNSHEEITEQVNMAIQKAKSRGVKVVLCTGRPIGGIHSFIDTLNLKGEDDFSITFNGAFVQNNRTKEVTSENFLTYKDLKAFYDLSQDVHSSMHYFDLTDMYTPNKKISRYTVYESHANQVQLHYRPMDETPEGIHIPKIMFIDDEEHLNKTIEAIPESYKEKYMLVKSAPFFLDILQPDVSKANAVKHLSEKFSIKREEIICIGDGENDLSMIEFAGCGVAMANATSSVKKAADFETLSNDENGVAHAIEKLIL